MEHGKGNRGTGAAVRGGPGRRRSEIDFRHHEQRPLPSSPSKKILLAALLADEPPGAGDGTVLKLYSPNNKGLLPNEAFRDAVEWLAGELGAR